MKLATFTYEGRTRIGLADESEIVDLAAAVPDLPSTAWTLEPGDVIATGTCGGVAAGGRRGTDGG